MTLTQELKVRIEASKKKIPAETHEIMNKGIQQLTEQGLAKNALQVGDKMIDFTLQNATNEPVSLSNQLKNGKVIISFYRGGWCPYCNMELKALQDILPELDKINVSLLAISPETPDNSLTTSEKNKLSFEVLSDIDNELAKKIGLVFQMPEELREIYQTFNIDVAKHNGNEDFELPLSATYLVNQKGVIEYAFISEDYKERAEPNDILDLLRD
jgi:peroxiredoxin